MGARDQATLNNASGSSFPATPPGEGATCPLRAKLVLGVFFDGTGNNMYRDQPNGEHTNVARLHNVYLEHCTQAGIQSKQYIVGIGAGDAQNPGSGDWNNYFSQAFGKGGKERLNIAYRWVKSQLPQVGAEDEKVIDVFGFSRGAALARTFANLIVQGMVMGRGGETIVPHLRVRFVGIFDTVGSFGSGGDNYNIHQSMYIENLGINRIAHYTARHEQRQNFPLTLCGGADREYPGVHSDVGGGYAPESNGTVNHIAFIPYKDMWQAGREVLVDMADWKSQVTISDARIEELRAEAEIYAPRGQGHAPPQRTYRGRPVQPREWDINQPVPDQVYPSLNRPQQNRRNRSGQWTNGATGPFSSPEHEERYNWWRTYIHDSVSGTPGMGRDSSGRRRKFMPKQRDLIAKPPDFDWSGER